MMLVSAPVLKSVNTPIADPQLQHVNQSGVAPTGTRFTGETLSYTVTVINSGLMTGTDFTSPIPFQWAQPTSPVARPFRAAVSCRMRRDVINWTGTVSASNRITVTYHNCADGHQW